jgi:hypothetical protein
VLLDSNVQRMENAVAYGKEYSVVQLMQSSAETIDAADNTYDVVTTGPAPGSESQPEA